MNDDRLFVRKYRWSTWSTNLFSVPSHPRHAAPHRGIQHVNYQAARCDIKAGCKSTKSDRKSGQRLSHQTRKQSEQKLGRAVTHSPGSQSTPTHTTQSQYDTIFWRDTGRRRRRLQSVSALHSAEKSGEKSAPFDVDDHERRARVGPSHHRGVTFLQHFDQFFHEARLWLHGTSSRGGRHTARLLTSRPHVPKPI